MSTLQIDTDKPVFSERTLTLLTRLVGALLAVFAIALLMQSPAGQWTGTQIQSASDGLKARAAFWMADDFTSDLQNGWGEQCVIREAANAVRVQGLALWQPTSNLESYRMDFETRLDAQGIGWVVRAADTENYYAFEIQVSEKRKTKTYKLVRYAVVDSKALDEEKTEIEIPAELIVEDFNRVSVHVHAGHMTTLINGQGVDHWQDDRFHHGAVGFYSTDAYTPAIQRVVVRGNEDSWGLVLYGLIESIKDAKEFVS